MSNSINYDDFSTSAIMDECIESIERSVKSNRNIKKLKSELSKDVKISDYELTVKNIDVQNEKCDLNIDITADSVAYAFRKKNKIANVPRVTISDFKVSVEDFELEKEDDSKKINSDELNEVTGGKRDFDDNKESSKKDEQKLQQAQNDFIENTQSILNEIKREMDSINDEIVQELKLCNQKMDMAWEVQTSIDDKIDLAVNQQRITNIRAEYNERSMNEVLEKANQYKKKLSDLKSEIMSKVIKLITGKMGIIERFKLIPDIMEKKKRLKPIEEKYNYIVQNKNRIYDSFRESVYYRTRDLLRDKFSADLTLDVETVEVSLREVTHYALPVTKQILNRNGIEL